jgi:hypothetical protein
MGSVDHPVLPPETHPHLLWGLPASWRNSAGLGGGASPGARRRKGPRRWLLVGLAQHPAHRRRQDLSSRRRQWCRGCCLRPGWPPAFLPRPIAATFRLEDHTGPQHQLDAAHRRQRPHPLAHLARRQQGRIGIGKAGHQGIRTQLERAAE